MSTDRRRPRSRYGRLVQDMVHHVFSHCQLTAAPSVLHSVRPAVTYRHILQRIFRRPCVPAGVGGWLAVGVGGNLAILSVLGAVPLPSARVSRYVL